MNTLKNLDTSRKLMKTSEIYLNIVICKNLPGTLNKFKYFNKTHFIRLM